MEIDLTSLFLLCLISVVIGAILMLLVQYYAFVKYFQYYEMPEATEEQKSINEKYLLPDVRAIKYYVQSSKVSS